MQPLAAAVLPTFPAGSTVWVAISYFSDLGLPFTPNIVNYQVVDLASGAVLVPWASIVPAVENTITVAPSQNEMVSFSRPWETHEVLFQITDGFGNVNYARGIYNLVAVTGVPVPQVQQISGVAIVQAHV